MIGVDERVVLLREAELRQRPVPRLTDAQPALTVAAAYELQQALVDTRLRAGERLVGAKLGLTSAAKREDVGVASPIYGRLTDRMRGQPELAQLIHPRAEPEIAIVLESELSAPASRDDVLAATRSVAPAIEIIDSRYRDFRFELADVIADNASAARFVLGEERSLGDLPPLPLIGCVLSVNGQVHATAAGAATMDDPAHAVAWLVERLAERGERLAPGSIVLSGGLTAAVPLASGSVVRAEFDVLGAVEVRA